MKETFFIRAAIAYFIIFALAAVGTFAQEGFRDIPADVQLVDRARFKAMPGITDETLAYFSWPTLDRILSAMRVSDEPLESAVARNTLPYGVVWDPRTVTDAKRTADNWIRRVLRDEWVPKDLLQVRLIALESDVNGYDSIRARWETGGFWIQVVQTNPAFTLVIRPAHQPPPVWFEPKEILKRFFKDAERLTSYTQRVEVPGGLWGKAAHSADPRGLGLVLNDVEFTTYPLVEAARGIPEAILMDPYQNPITMYWGNAAWWFDGQCFVFVCFKDFGGQIVVQSAPKQWFVRRE